MGHRGTNIHMRVNSRESEAKSVIFENLGVNV